MHLPEAVIMRRRAFLALPLAALGANEPKEAERIQAIERGLKFIYRTARDRAAFTEYGSDYLFCLYGVGATTIYSRVKQIAWKMGRERARQWRRDHPGVPAKVSAETLADLAYGSYVCDLLGLTSQPFQEQVRQSALRFTAKDFLWFDPVKEGIPADIPRPCKQCKTQNKRGLRHCIKCGAELRMHYVYDLLFDALLGTYFGDRYGVTLGANFADVVKWIPSVRPYPVPTEWNDTDYSVAYTITHIVYALNDYTTYRLKPEWLPQEFAYLKNHLRDQIRLNDPETLGEFTDTLKSFGLTREDPLIRDAEDFLFDCQNPDGSWGDPKNPDVYDRYHTTWTAIGALDNYAWAGERLSFPDVLKLLN